MPDSREDTMNQLTMTRACLDRIVALRETNSLLLGLTGGIASGKTTVANMLRDMGSHLIDFDILARQVVEPGKPAWKDIVDYFGRQVLRANEHLDRKKLSKTVFQDPGKRTRLERFTHPRIFEEFVDQATRIINEDPCAIIQAVMPLLIETNLVHLFHKIVVVYIPREKQIERLIRRDGITREEAAEILEAQLAIDEKVEYADFVIHNEGSINETEKEVKDLWKELKALQTMRKEIW